MNNNAFSPKFEVLQKDPKMNLNTRELEWTSKVLKNKEKLPSMSLSCVVHIVSPY